ncbi:MAG: hypothetical protein LUE29_04385 [Lachnospiraceae bacterium]|nr:hypothetical protein [Lachnospiraceae bacterium]
MRHAIRVTPILDSQNICSVHLADGTERCLTTEKLNCPDIAEKLRGGIEHCHIEIDDDFCVIVLSDDNMQWGYTVVWNYMENEIVHLVQTPFAVSAIVYDSQVIVMYLVQYWGHLADLWYSIEPLLEVNSEHEPDRIRLDMPIDDSVKGPDSCRITLQLGKVVFRAGNQEKAIKITAGAIK